MITVSNIQRFIGLSFETYTQLPGYSHSWLKREVNGTCAEIQATPKMQLGTLVDEIRTGGSPDMRHQLYPAARKIAYKLQKEFPFLDALVPQVSYTGVLHYAGFNLPVKGRPDFELKKHAIIDLKVTHAKDIAGVCKYMAYENQQFNYGRLADVPIAYLLVYSVPLDDTKLIPIKIQQSNKFWEDKILKFGKV